MQAAQPSHSAPRFDVASINKACRDSEQIMVYGWEHTEYEQLSIFAGNIMRPAKRVFDYNLGRLEDLQRMKTLEGRIFERISFEDCHEVDEDESDVSERTEEVEDVETVKKIAKSALVNLILENCKRKKESLPLIPLLFVIDIDDNPYPANIDTISIRKENDYVTNSELRRLYKLCSLEADAFIADVAQESVVMVTVKASKISPGVLKLEEKRPFWQHKDWKELWAKRQLTAKNTPKAHNWKTQLLSRWNRYLTTQPSGEKRRKC